MPGPVALVGAGEFLPATSALDAGLLAATGRSRPRVAILPTASYPDGETVFRCRKGDVGDLAATIARALANPELRATVGAAGRQRVLERWTWKRCAELTVEQYREVLAMPQNVAKLRRNGRI